jgi:L-lactate dehydrogenase
VLVVATNPVDVMTHLTARYAADFGVPGRRVIGSGTTLDTARFRALLGRHLGVDPQHVHAYVLGEHGDSEVLAWSEVSIGGIPLEDFCFEPGREVTEAVKRDIDEQVRRAAYRIIEGKGATYYGIGSALARIVHVILHDQRALLTVCTPVAEVVGVRDVTVALPNLLGGSGVRATCLFELSDDERAGLRASAQIVRDAITSLEQS